MDAYVSSVTRYLFAQSWQIALLAVIAGLASHALRYRSAHVRYLLWLIVLAKCLVPPLYSVPIAVLPERPPIEHARGATFPRTPIEESVASGVVESVTIEEARGTSQKQLTLPSITETTVLIWLTGMSLFLLWVGGRAVRYHLWLHRRRTPVPSALAREFHELLVSFKFRKQPRLWLAGEIAQPFVWGLFRGSVYLPADFAGLESTERHRTLLAHELSHIARLDAAVNALQILAQAIFWFHPFVWWVNIKIREEREKCCDEMAVAQLSTNPAHYTDAIVEALATERRSAHPAPSLAIVGSVKDIEERIKTMLRPGKKFHRHPSVRAVAVLLTVALLTIPTNWGLARRARAEKASEPQERPSKLLFQAATDGDNDQINLYLALGVDVNTKNRKGEPLLHVAVDNRKIETARLLIQKGADVNSKNAVGYTPLHLAALHSDLKTANLLISKGADVNAKDKYGITPVSRALLSDGGGRLMVELLVSNGAKVSELHLAAHRGDIDKVRSCLEKGANVDMRNMAGHTPLFYAASAGQMHVVDYLISKGADVNAKDNRQGETPLFYAGDAGWKNVVELLIDKGADINARGALHSNTLESAAWLGRSDIAKLLITKGVDVNIRNDHGYTPLHPAAINGLVEIVEMLISKGSDVNAKTNWGETPLHSATGSKTPLYSATLEGRMRVAQILIANGADVNAKDDFGLTPLQMAQRRGYTEIVELLKKHGAEE